MSLVAESLRANGRLAGVSMSLEPGSVVAVVGPNGAGKSSLLAACLGRLRLQDGTVRVDGHDVARMRPRERAGWLGWLPQRAAAAEGMTALEVVAAARFRFGEGRSASERAAREALDGVGLEPSADRRLDTLSGGEQQRVRLAALVAQDARLWLLDEPGNHLDPSAQLDLWARIGQQAEQGRGVLVVSHDIGLLSHLPAGSTRVLGLDAGVTRWTLGLQDPGLADALGELLGLDVSRVHVDGVDRLVIVGRRP